MAVWRPMHGRPRTSVGRRLLSLTITLLGVRNDLTSLHRERSPRVRCRSVAVVFIAEQHRGRKSDDDKLTDLRRYVIVKSDARKLATIDLEKRDRGIAGGRHVD